MAETIFFLVAAVALFAVSFFAATRGLSPSWIGPRYAPLWVVTGVVCGLVSLYRAFA